MTEFPVSLSDDVLAEINSLLPWFAATALPDGRLVGQLGTRENKRSTVQQLPDKRIVRLNDALGLAGKRVLELGCFEGIHTLALRQYGADVTAVDVRPVNVLKTLMRLSAYGTSAHVYTFDVEGSLQALGEYDVVFHCGVLYHLADPVRHLQRLLPHCRDAVYLDTHIAARDRTAHLLESGGQTYRGYRFAEGGWSDPFSGSGKFAFWLTLDDLVELLRNHGFTSEVWSERDERNGPRVGLLARRS